MDAWKQLDELLERFTEEWEVRPDLKVTGRATERDVQLTMIEFDHTVDNLDPRRKRYHSTERNISTMRELAQALLDACDFVEKSNPTWAGKPFVTSPPTWYMDAPPHRDIGQGWCVCGRKASVCDR